MSAFALKWTCFVIALLSSGAVLVCIPRAPWRTWLGAGFVAVALAGGIIFALQIEDRRDLADVSTRLAAARARFDELGPGTGKSQRHTQAELSARQAELTSLSTELKAISDTSSALRVGRNHHEIAFALPLVLGLAFSLAITVLQRRSRGFPSR